MPQLDEEEEIRDFDLPSHIHKAGMPSIHRFVWNQYVVL